jgi:hypothetical protein
MPPFALPVPSKLLIVEMFSPSPLEIMPMIPKIIILTNVELFLDFQCDASYTRSDGSRACGFFVKGSLTWHEAVEKCAQYGSRLPEIQSRKDNINILALKVRAYFIRL